MIEAAQIRGLFGGLLEERVTRGTVAVKAVSTALIVGGVATISL